MIREVQHDLLMWLWLIIEIIQLVIFVAVATWGIKEVFPLILKLVELSA